MSVEPPGLSTRLAGLAGWRAAAIWSLIATATLRVGLGATMAAGWTLVKPYLPVHQLDDPMIYGHLRMPTGPPGDTLLGVWVRWDAIHHLNLALRGYADVPVGDTIFYPLYAFLVRCVAGVLGGDVILAGLLVSTVATWAAFACLHRLAETWLGPATARWSVLALASFPTSLFLIAPFTESLFIALTIGAFLAAYKDHWWTAGALGLAASLTRGPGMLTAAAFAIIAYRRWRLSGRRAVEYWPVPLVAGLGLPLAAGLGFLIWRSVSGFPAVPDVLRGSSGLILTNPFSGVVASLKQWLRAGDLTMTLEILAAAGFVALVGAMVLNPRWRRPEWLAYVALNLALFLSKQSLTGSSLQSLPRYVLVLFPCFIVMGDWLAARSDRTRFIYLAGSSAVLLVLGVLYTLWFFIA